MDNRVRLLNIFEDKDKREKFEEYLEFLELNTRASDLNKVIDGIFISDGLITTVGILNILSDSFSSITIRFFKIKKAQNYLMNNET